MILIAVLYLICASTFTISKNALNYADPIFFTGVRMTLSGILLLSYHLVRNGYSLRLKRDHYLLFGQVVLFYIYLAYVFDILALQHLTSAKACLLYDLSPFITALFSYFAFREVMTTKKWVGLSIGLVGFLPSLLSQAAREAAPVGVPFLLPEGLMLGAVVSSVYGWVVVRKLVREGSYSPVLINGVAMLGGGLLALLTSFFWEGWYTAPVTNVGQFALYTGLIILTSSVLFSNLYAYLLKKYSATLLSFAGFTAPLFAALLGGIFLGETVSWDFFVTTGFVVFGIYLFYQEELKQGYVLD
ncbi:DMT family transporter [Candidatus Babeliales bacterium]|nr:DMT family transporter [Candidatus Babeliales bacterium]